MLFISVCFFASAFAIPPAAETGLANQNQALQEANVDLMHQIEQKVGASNLETAIGSSWDHYIDWVIGQSGNVADKVAMFGLNGAAYTSETHANAMKLSQEERMAIANAFKTQDLGGLQNGFFVEGIRYLLLRSDPQMVIYGKLRGRGGITAHRTKSAIIIGHYPDGKNPKQMNYAIAACAETLEGWGYQEVSLAAKKKRNKRKRKGAKKRKNKKKGEKEKRDVGETCGYVYGIGSVGDCDDGLQCACVGACADPNIADAPTTCIEEPGFNCLTKEKWTEEKTEWCCENEQLGCTVTNICEDRNEDLATIMMVEGYTCATALEDYPSNMCANELFIPYCCKTCSVKEETYSGAYSVLGQSKGVVVASFAFIGAISLIWHASRTFHKAYVSSEFTPIHEAEL